MKHSLPFFFALLAACDGGPGDDQRRRRNQLEALGYLSEAPVRDEDIGKRGVTRHDRSRVAAGFTVYCSEAASYFSLLDMEGREHHRVELPGWCKHVEPHGRDFLVLHGARRPQDSPKGAKEHLSRIGWDGAIRWTNRSHLHHDFAVAPDGRIYAIGAREGTIRYGGAELPELEDLVVVIDEETGERLGSIALSPLMRPFVEEAALKRLHEASTEDPEGATKELQRAADLYHTNSIERLERDSAIGENGGWLIGTRHLDLVLAVDAEFRDVTWHYGKHALDKPHHPQLLESGNILVYDNGAERGWSRIIELEPGSKEIVWSYERRSHPPFYSETRGSVQLLPNRNLLVAESDRGRWFEITRAGDVVWELYAPDSNRAGGDGRFMRQTTYRTQRLFAGSLTNEAYQKLWREVFGTHDS